MNKYEKILTMERNYEQLEKENADLKFNIKVFKRAIEVNAPKPGAEEVIKNLISDICISMKAEDYLDLPDLIHDIIPVMLDSKTQAAYDKLEKQMCLEIDADTVIDYGLNLQEGGNHIIWFGLNWSLELYQQANARLYRQGQTEKVIVHHLIVEGGVDEDVMTALEDKSATQNRLMAALKARIDKYREV